ncbi:hypothetical protein [Actinomadura sp. GTD37]|uniref:hypothetical protein n=1 Tax=Actinomadura sp. GTD37 TaxID=1778030 RepID=UPI0035C1128B
MTPFTRRRTVAAALAGGAVALTTAYSTTATPATAAAGETRRHEEPSVAGTAKIHYGYAPDDDIRFTIQARGYYTLARGTFHFSHSGTAPDGTRVTGKAWGTVDCLATGGDTATLTGTIVRTEPPGLISGAVGFSVSGSGGHQRFGFSWGILPPPADLPRCYGIAPFTTVTSGRFNVRHVAPPPGTPPWLEGGSKLAPLKPHAGASRTA